MTEAVDISCNGCGAALRVEPHLKTSNCPYCASTAVVERPPTPDRPDPTFVVGFVVQHDAAVEKVQRWIRSRSMFARSDFKAAVVNSVRGVYLPAYLYGATAHSDYSAEIGENYTETYTTTVNGKTVTRTRTRTEWRSLYGSHACYVVDVVVTASKGIRNRELEAIEPFDLRAIRRYDAGMIAGWAAEEPSMSAAACTKLAHDESLEGIGKELGAFMPGDSHRGLEFKTRVDEETTDLVMLPLWSCAVRYAEDEEPVRLLVNGQTGKVGGKVPLSPLKITIVVLVVLVIVGFIILKIAEAR